MAKSPTTRFTVSLPDELMATLDRLRSERGYVNRSEFVRDLLRGELVKEEWTEQSGETVGVVLLGESCDPFSVEAVRASMGSIFTVKLARAFRPPRQGSREDQRALGRTRSCPERSTPLPGRPLRQPAHGTDRQTPPRL
jgi:Arc/MetJ-type ribon-helix-helix transcriptional regulator